MSTKEFMIGALIGGVIGALPSLALNKNEIESLLYSKPKKKTAAKSQYKHAVRNPKIAKKLVKKSTTSHSKSSHGHTKPHK